MPLSLLDLFRGFAGQGLEAQKAKNASIDEQFTKMFGDMTTHAGGAQGWMQDRNQFRTMMGWGGGSGPQADLFKALSGGDTQAANNSIVSMLLGARPGDSAGATKWDKDFESLGAALSNPWTGGQASAAGAAGATDGGQGGFNFGSQGWYGRQDNGNFNYGVPNVWQPFFQRAFEMNQTLPNFMGYMQNQQNPYDFMNSMAPGMQGNIQGLLSGLMGGGQGYANQNTSAQNSLEGFLSSLMGRGGPNMPGAPNLQQYGNAPALGQYGSVSAPWMTSPNAGQLNLQSLFGDISGLTGMPGFGGPETPQWQGAGGIERINRGQGQGMMSLQDALGLARSNSGGFNLGRENLPLSNFQQNQLYGTRQGMATDAFSRAAAGAESMMNQKATDVTGLLDKARDSMFTEALRVGKGQAASRGALGGSLSDRLVSERLGEAANKAYATQADAILRATAQNDQTRMGGLSTLAGLAPSAAGTGMDIASLLSGETQNLASLLVGQRGQDVQSRLGQFTNPADMLRAITGHDASREGMNQGWQDLLQSAYGLETGRITQNDTANQARNQWNLDALLGGFNTGTDRFRAESGARTSLIDALTGRGSAMGGLEQAMRELQVNADLSTNQLNVGSLLDAFGLNSQNMTNQNNALTQLFGIQSDNTSAINNVLSQIFGTQTQGAVDSYNAETGSIGNILSNLLGLGGQQQSGNEFAAGQNTNLMNSLMSNLFGGAQGNMDWNAMNLGAMGTQSDQFFTMMQLLQWMAEFDPGANPKLGGT